MFDFENEINDVYKKADELFKIRIKSQLKGSGLIFEKFEFVTDVLTGQESYNLVINKKVIAFNSSINLYNGLLKLIEYEEKENLKEIRAIESNKNFTAAGFDLELLYNKENKLSQLSARIKDLLKK
jgi:hypothetical protein